MTRAQRVRAVRLFLGGASTSEVSYDFKNRNIDSYAVADAIRWALRTPGWDEPANKKARRK
jgi:hypothetical protein